MKRCLMHHQRKGVLKEKEKENENLINDKTVLKIVETLCSFRAIQTTTGATEAEVASVASAAASASPPCSLSEESQAAKEMSRISTTTRKQAQYQFGPSPASKLHLPSVQS